MEKTITWALQPFASLGAQTPTGMHVGVTLRADFPRFVVQYRVQPAPEGLTPSSRRTTIPPTSDAELWKTNCFELFVKPADAPWYHEWNFSPDATAYAHFDFLKYREPGALLKQTTGRPETLRSERAGALNSALNDAFTLEAQIDLSVSPHLIWAWINALPLQIHPTAILEVDGKLTYWAPAHPDAKADFHDASVYSEVVLP